MCLPCICYQDCDLLENELCQLEYALAKKHQLIGRQIEMLECVNLPAVDSPENEGCLQLGMPQPDPVKKGANQQFVVLSFFMIVVKLFLCIFLYIDAV